MQQASFLIHLHSFVFCLLPIVLTLCVYCLLSAFFFHMSTLLWLHQLCSHTHHHHMSTAAAAVPFYDKIYCRDDVAGFAQVLRFKVWKLRFSRSNLWHQMTNRSGRYAAGLIFTSFDIRFLSYFVWNLTFNNLNRMSKIWHPKIDVINSFTYGWPLAPKTDVINSSVCNWWSEAVADGLRSIDLFPFVLPLLFREFREQHV